MIRDTFFSLHRFVNVCRKEMVENWKTYILRSVMVYGMFCDSFVGMDTISITIWKRELWAWTLSGSLSPDSFFGDLSFGDALAPRLPWKG